MKKLAPVVSAFGESDDRLKEIYERQKVLRLYDPDGDEWWQLEAERRWLEGRQKRIIDENKDLIAQAAKALGVSLLEVSPEELLRALRNRKDTPRAKAKPAPVGVLGLVLEAERRAERQSQLEREHQARAGISESAGTFVLSGNYALTPGAESGATIPGSSKKPDKKPKIRSTFRQRVLNYLIDHRGASAKNVCEWCDRNEIRGPESWYTGPNDRRSLVVIYNSNLVIKGRIDKYVSDVHKYIEKYL